LFAERVQRRALGERLHGNLLSWIACAPLKPG
jgi:hypothetical protein